MTKWPGLVLIGIIGIIIAVLIGVYRRKSSETVEDRGDRSVSEKDIQTSQQQANTCPFQVQDVADFINKVEAETAEIYDETFKELHRYHEYLKNILDIRCSLFRRKTKRIELQEQLTLDVLNSKYQVVALSELEEIFNNDHKFCADKAENNGKLRQVYMKLWKTRTVRNRYKRIADRLKQAFP